MSDIASQLAAAKAELDEARKDARWEAENRAGMVRNAKLTAVLETRLEMKDQLTSAPAERDLDWIEALGLQGAASTPAEAATYIEGAWLTRKLVAAKVEQNPLDGAGKIA